MFDLAVGAQPFVLAREPFDVLRVLQCDRGDAGDDREQVQMIFVERLRAVGRGQIDRAERPPAEHERHAQERARARRFKAGDARELRALGHVVRQERHAALQDLLRDGATNLQGLLRVRRARPTIDGHDLVHGRAYKQDRAALGRNDLEDRFE